MVDNKIDNKFVAKYNLHSTMKNFLKEKLLRCKKCSRTFSQKQNYIQHIKSHDYEKLFGCSLCDFATNTNEILDKEFGNMTDYDRHRKLNHSRLSNHIEVNLANC